MKLGMIQQMVFQDDDNPPFYEKTHQSMMKLLLRKNVYLKAQELGNILKSANVSDHGNVDVMKQWCLNLNVPIKEKRPVIIPGYVGKPKGFMLFANHTFLLD